MTQSTKTKSKPTSKFDPLAPLGPVPPEGFTTSRGFQIWLSQRQLPPDTSIIASPVGTIAALQFRPFPSRRKLSSLTVVAPPHYGASLLVGIDPGNPGVVFSNKIGAHVYYQLGNRLSPLRGILTGLIQLKLATKEEVARHLDATVTVRENSKRRGQVRALEDLAAELGVSFTAPQRKQLAKIRGDDA